MRTRRLFLASFAIAAALGHAAMAAEQAYPSRPITMVVPFAAGGPTDTIARTMAEHMRVSLGQPVILEHVAGAAGSIGWDKRRRVVFAARHYLLRLRQPPPCRFDVVSMENGALQWMRAAFDAG